MTPTQSLFRSRSWLGKIGASYKSLIFPATAVLNLIFISAPCHGSGTVVAWGDNSSLQSTVPGHGAVRLVTAVAGGASHSLALEANGVVVAWGDNSKGETNTPVNLTNAVAIAAGNGFNLALKSNGSVLTWGVSPAIPAGLTNVTAVAASMNNLMALRNDGSVVTWGVGPVPPPTATNIVAIAAGNQHCLALRGDGLVIAWGDDTLGQTDVPLGLTNVVALAAGASNSLALESDGTVVAWGDNRWGQSSVPAGLQNVVAIAAGANHCLALQQNGAVVAWGNNTYFQTNVPAGAGNAAAIGAGNNHSLAVTASGLPVITVQPVSKLDLDSATATFSVMAEGLAPLSYQWTENGTNLPGATNSVLTLPNFSTSGAIVFSVTVSNSLGTVTSAGAQLPAAWRPPSFALQPQSETVNCGDPVSLQIIVAGTPPYRCQWQLNGTNLPGATNVTLTVPAVTSVNGGSYTVVVTNANGVTISQEAVLTIVGQPPLITSALTVSGKQGTSFSYTIAGLHNPTTFFASGLPVGLSVNSINGAITGTPLQSGTFTVTLGTANDCASASTNLTLTIASSIPVITSSLKASGTEDSAFSYTIKASDLPTGFGAVNLPQGLALNPNTGLISGIPLYAGTFPVLITASNTWGVGSANLQLTISNVPVQGLSISDVVTNYSSPYLLDFTFSLRDDSDPTIGHAVVTDPSQLVLTAFEDGVSVDPTETSVLIAPASSKVLKAYLVLDFTESVANADGVLDSNGVPIAVNSEVTAAQNFVNQQPANAQIGVYEFHREDEAPQLVQSLTVDKMQLNNSIAGIWTNYVAGFPAGSRCWDALAAAVGSLGPTNADEQHYVIFCSDGGDTSSSNTVQTVLKAATNANVQVFCVGFGAAINTAALQFLTSQTHGRYYEATNSAALTTDFGLIGKDLGGLYVLRWATLQRSTNTFIPSFQISYQGMTALSPPNPPPTVTGTNYVIDTNSVPPVTNAVYTYKTNYSIPPYQPSAYAGNVTVGSLRLVADAQILPSAVTLRATYVPRYVRQLRLHYRPNWPCTLNLESTNVGQQLYGWKLAQTNDGAGGYWATLTSSNQSLLSSSIPFASFGPLLSFTFKDVLNASNAFSIFEVDNSVYTNSGNQSFTFENTNQFITVYPALPFGTPVPWLISYGFANSNNWASLETNDLNGNGFTIWQDYLAGLNPTNSSSVFAVHNVLPSGSSGHWQIVFSTAVNRTYRIDTSSDLVNWQVLQDKIAGTGQSITFTDPRFLSAAGYYRLIVY